MKGFTIILPLLNEDLSIVKKVISVSFDMLKSLKIQGEIIIVDGGSRHKLMEKINKFGTEKQNKLVKFKYILDYPVIKPNKNIGIINGYYNASYDNILIADSDNINLTTNKLKKLINPLIKGKSSFVIADLQRKSGRSNHLLGKPPMRLFFPEIYRKIPYPYPGLLAIKKKLLRKIIKKDYCFDWGGEAQIAINSYLFSKGNVSSFNINKIDSKKRVLRSMIKDAFQLYRTNLLLAIQNNKFPSTTEEVDIMIERDITNHKKESKRLIYYIKTEKKINGLLCNNLYETYNNLVSYSNKNPKKIYDMLHLYSKSYNFYELEIINSLVVRTLLNILFNIKIKDKLLEIRIKDIPKLEMRKISFFSDLIIAAMLKIYLQGKKNRVPFSDLKSMLAKSDKAYTEFNDINYKNLIFGECKKGININEVNSETLKRILNLVNLNKVEERNKRIGNLINEELIGNVSGTRFTLKNLNLRKESIDISIDLFVRLSILTMLAGYLKKNKIYLNSEQYKQQMLERFLSYILNNKKFAPIDYKLKLNFSGIKSEKRQFKHNYDCVILFSGGFDSTATFLTALDKGLKPLLLWVGFGQKNEGAEYKVIKSISRRIRYPVSIIKIDLKKYIDKGWKEWDYIIPARNFIFAALAASFLSRSLKPNTIVYISAHKEEIKHSNTDKSMHFFNTCTSLFSDYYKKKIVIGTSFRKYSKTEIAAHWKNHWIEKYGILPYDTITCYYGNYCGKCKACLKRTISFLAAGWAPDPNIQVHPMSDPNDFLITDILLRLNRFSKNRKMETLIAIRKAWEVVPESVKKKYESFDKRLIKESLRYENTLKKFKINLQNAK